MKISQNPAYPAAEATLPLIVAADRNYVTGLVVTVVSAIRNLDPGWKLDIRVLDSGIGSDYQQQLQKSLAPILGDRHALSFHPICGDLLSSFPITNTYLSPAAYARFQISELFPDLKKAIYSDTDIIINKDLASVFKQELSTSIAACADVRGTLGNTKDALLYNDLGFNAKAPYFNSGFLILDLERIRSLKTSERIAQLCSRAAFNPQQEDQTILNVVHYQDWTKLDPSWNRLIILSENRPRIPYREAVNYHAILKFKPWFYHRNGSYGIIQQFYRYLDMTDWEKRHVDEKRYNVNFTRGAYMRRAIRMWATEYVYQAYGAISGKRILRRA